MLTNTQYFREPAIHFEKHGYYTNAPAGTKEWEDYWDMQRERSLNGYSVAGMQITGYHYWYLNFGRIKRISDAALRGEKVDVTGKNFGPPAFYDGDYNYFWCVDIARNGISEQDYKKLNLDVDILDLSGSKHLVVLKSRRKGYSYKNAAMLARNYHLMRGSRGYAISAEKEYLDPDKDGVLDKVWSQINFVDNYTAFRQPRITDRKWEKKSGYKRNIGGTDVERGMKSMISSVSLLGDPGKAVGKEGEIILFEEAGKTPDLLKAWKLCRPSVEDGAFTTGIMIGFGTGGEEGAESIAGLQELFYSPEAYNVLPLNNVWDEGTEGTSCSFFHPVFWNYPGFMDKDGNSDVEGAKKHEEKQRENAKKAPDPTALSQHVSEHPFTPSEATLQTSQNIFPIAELQNHLNNIRAKGMDKFGVAGSLYYADDGVKFRPNDKAKPIVKYPHSKNQDLTGAPVIYQTPYRDSEQNVPKNMYIACLDPYIHDTSTDMTSLGSVHILKRTNKLDHSMNDCVVASYTGRPSTQDEFLRTVFMLAEYYNCKIAFENNVGNVVEYARRTKQLHKLEQQFEVMTTTDTGKKVKKAGSHRKFGIRMTTQRKEQAEVYVRDWLNEVIGTTEDGHTKLRLHNIYNIPLLQELIKFNKKGNFDRCLLPNTSIFTRSGYKKVEEITEEDQVLTHDGTYKDVNIVSNHTSEYNKYLELSFRGEYEKLNVTPNHPVYTFPLKRIGYSKKKQKRQIDNRDPQYIEAEKLTKLHRVLRPKRKNLKNIKYSDDLLYLMGWYLSDGYINKECNLLKIFLQGDQEKIADRLVDIINKHIEPKTFISGYERGDVGDMPSRINDRRKKATKKVYKNKYMIDVSVTSKFLSNLFIKHFGSSNNKKISNYIFNSFGLLPLVIGFLEGDGHQKINVSSTDKYLRNSIECSSVYEDVVKKIRQILIDEGVYTSCRKVKPRDGNHQWQYCFQITGEDINKIARHSIKFKEIDGMRNYNTAIETEEGFWLTINSIKEFDLTKNVYNFEVEDNHSYVASNIVTHNCSALFIGMYYLKELHSRKVVEEEVSPHHDFFLKKFHFQ